MKKPNRSASSKTLTFIKALKFVVPALIIAGTAVYISMGGANTSDSSAPSSVQSSTSSSSSQPLTLRQALPTAKGFVTGDPMSSKQVFVFFDPQCPHCGHLWTQIASLDKNVKITWIPVGILGRKSAHQGAVLLSSADPVKAMTTHEASLASTGGISGDASKELAEAVQRNTEIFSTTGVKSVPLVVYYPSLMAASPLLKTGSMSTQMFLDFIK